MKILNTLIKRGLALFLVLTMCVSFLPATALAEELAEEETAPVLTEELAGEETDSAEEILPQESGEAEAPQEESPSLPQESGEAEAPQEESPSLPQEGGEAGAPQEESPSLLEQIGDAISDAIGGLFGWGNPLAIQPGDAAVVYVKFFAEGNLVDGKTLQSGEAMGALPTAPNVPGKIFDKWADRDGRAVTETDTFTVEGESITIEVHAVYAELRTVTFENGSGTVLAAMSVRDGQSLAEAGYSLDSVKFQPANGQTFVCWKAGSDVFTADTKVSADITVTPEVTTGYWVAFDGNGGTDLPSVLVGTDDKVAAPTAQPQRPGYDFQGWYTAPENGEKVEFDRNRFPVGGTVYAYWKASEQTQYTVRYWAEKVPADAYDVTAKSYTAEPGAYERFHEDETATGPTGSIVDKATLSGRGLLHNPGAGFGAGTNDEGQATVIEARIAADGSTVVNVYYNRMVYTLSFEYYEGIKWHPLKSVNGNGIVQAKYGAYIADQLSAKDCQGWGQGWTTREGKLVRGTGDRVNLPTTMPAKCKRKISGRVYKERKL